ncbi:hypothetical protein N7532_005708 [Penicillium argentinense]|uniref:Uncharacterized protein n=1 Tax=Penicillium argentinense TaxID=1131581 RepID=A0A9W9FEY5_9EURO|nr:uncharacterized protein N7532_005708 [Penicillium argentinense]KAJ5098707.1 hypothetical protein N7532_005708 [Penicillium argentinense]
MVVIYGLHCFNSWAAQAAQGRIKKQLRDTWGLLYYRQEAEIAGRLKPDARSSLFDILDPEVNALLRHILQAPAETFDLVASEADVLVSMGSLVETYKALYEVMDIMPHDLWLQSQTISEDIFTRVTEEETVVVREDDEATMGTQMETTRDASRAMEVTYLAAIV